MRTVYLDGIALWSLALPGWDVAAPALRGGLMPVGDAAQRRPAPALLAANERRRAPDAVLLALEVAAAAMAGSGHDAAAIASVFTSAHGDLATTDAQCRTLADSPLALSPTRFHHSVHNAASGYWAMASGSRAASTALSAHAHSGAAGWLEAAVQVAADEAPVLLVCHDTEATGPLASVNGSRGLLAAALVLAPRRSGASRWAVQWQLCPGPGAAPPLHGEAAHRLAANAMADVLPLMQALAAGTDTTLSWPLGPRLHLRLSLRCLGAAQGRQAVASSPPTSPDLS